MIIISGTTIATPSSFSVSIADISNNSYRNANGKMLIERVATKRKLEVGYNYISNTDSAIVLALIGTSSIFFSVTYPDPQTGANRTGTFYVGDRPVGIMDCLAGVTRWKDLKFSLIEQ